MRSTHPFQSPPFSLISTLPPRPAGHQLACSSYLGCSVLTQLGLKLLRPGGVYSDIWLTKYVIFSYAARATIPGESNIKSGDSPFFYFVLKIIMARPERSFNDGACESCFTSYPLGPNWVLTFNIGNLHLTSSTRPLFSSSIGERNAVRLS